MSNTTSRRVSAAAAISVLLLAAACAEQSLPTGPVPSHPLLEIADASRAYKSGFYWLPPLSADPQHDGTFDAALSPRIEICELAGEGCGAVIAIFTMTEETGGELVRLSLSDEHYHVNWHTDQFDLSTTSLYRVAVYAGAANVLLGYADVQPVDNGSGLRNVNTEENIGLVDGRTLPIKMRIETGIVGRVEVQPAEATAEPGSAQQFVAVLRDLHENLMTDDVAWTTSDEAVATVDQTGLATAIADGWATITATSERISGTALLTVEGGLLAVSMVSSGGLHACALAPDGRAFCWGTNFNGQVGDGSTSTRLSPVAVAGGLKFAAIDAGGSHTCGLTAVGEAWCWGLGSAGQLGNGSTGRQLTPVAVTGGQRFTTISAGQTHTCAIAADGTGQAYCWGDSRFGALGNGSQVNAVTPQAVSGGFAFASITAGFLRACGVTTNGAGYCWGWGSSYVLGNGSTDNRLTPAPVSGGLAFQSIHLGQAHACGVTTAGAGYCWGVGAIGNGHSESRTPSLAAGGHLWNSISAASGHSCGVTTDGRGFCWGANFDGALGDGTEVGRSTPSAVAGGITWRLISAGHQGYTCGVSVEDRTYCWGNGLWGQLGTGSTTRQLTPIEIAAFPE